MNGKPSSPVLRGLGASNGARPLDSNPDCNMGVGTDKSASDYRKSGRVQSAIVVGLRANRKLLRHSKIRGLCEDKEARTVGKEQAGES